MKTNEIKKGWMKMLDRFDQGTELEELTEELEAFEQQADEQINILEIRMKDVENLQNSLESLSEQLSNIEGDAWKIVQQDIEQQIQQKENEAEECQNNLREISETMEEKQGEVKQVIAERGEARSELQNLKNEVEFSDDALSESEEAVSDELQKLENADAKIEEILSKINGALTDKQAQKKTEHLNLVGKSVEQLFSNALADNKLENKNHESRNDQTYRFRRVGEKYDWQLESPDAINYSKFRDKSSKGDKNKVSEALGDSYGHRFATEVLGYETKLDPDSKNRSFRQGFDSVYYDRETGQTVIGEFKGQDSQESEKQKRIRWTPDVCEKMINRQGVYARATQDERDLAFDIQKEFDRGMVRYEVIRTKFDEKASNIYTVVEKRKYSDYE